MSVLLTQTGIRKTELYIDGLKEKRKEILDAGKDTADDTFLPSVSDIISDIEEFEQEGEYWNGWGVTDSYDADGPIHLEEGVDYYVRRSYERDEPPVITVNTSLGALSVYALDDAERCPGFVVMLKPDGWGDPRTEDSTYLEKFGKEDLNEAKGL